MTRTGTANNSLSATIKRRTRPFRRKLTLRVNRWLGRLRDPVWLIGEGRSGTTWVSGLINANDRMLERFEPFHPHHNPRLQSYPKLEYRHPDQEDPVLERHIRDIFRASYWAKGIDPARPSGLFAGLLVKDIFATLIARWVIKRFPRIRPILLVRNPFAVARSKCEADKGWFWADDVQVFLDDAALMQDHLAPFEGILREVARRDEPFLHHMAVWAIVHTVVLRQFAPGTIHVVFYEDAVADSQRVAAGINRYLGRPIAAPQDSGTWDERSSSRVSQADKVARSRKDPYGSWREGLRDELFEDGQRILAAFGLDRLYGDDGRPDLCRMTFAGQGC